MLVQFIPNADGITVDVIINDKHRLEEVAYVPSKLVDQRALALRIFARNMGKGDDIFVFENPQIKHEMRRHFNYLNNPVYVKRRVQRRGRTLSFSL